MMGIGKEKKKPLMKSNQQKKSYKADVSFKILKMEKYTTIMCSEISNFMLS